MTPRRWALFIGINILVSAITALLVMNLWESNRGGAAPRPIVPTAVPTLNAVAQTQVAATATAAPTSTTTPGNSRKYVVKSGDTLTAIADEFGVTVADLVAANKLTNVDVLSLGQELTIPGSPLTPTPTLVPIPTSTRSTLPVITGTASTALGEYFVTIREIKSLGALAAEQVILTNLSGQVNLADWTMTDGEGHKFTFPNLTLLSNGEVTVHTNKGTNTPTDLYWGQTESRWSKGKVAYLRDPAGKLIATYQVP
jgi:LysM repeat protein